MFLHHNIHKYTLTLLRHNQIDHILVDRRCHSSITVQSLTMMLTIVWWLQKLVREQI